MNTRRATLRRLSATQRILGELFVETSDAVTISGRIVSMPTREQINLPVQEQLIVELYSK